MRLFKFFKGKSLEKHPAPVQATISGTDNNSFLLSVLQKRIIELGLQVERHEQYQALIVNDEVEIATVIIDNPNNHPNVLHLMVLAIHPEYFPDGIEDHIAGIGTAMQGKIDTALDNYINTTFLTIMDSFSDSHHAESDFSTTINGREILWHPKFGNLALQGQWGDQSFDQPFFEILRGRIKDKLTTRKLNWLKLYISRQADGTITGECLFNNEPWEEGLTDLSKYAKTWERKGNFQGLKQFIMFRRCDAFDM